MNVLQQQLHICISMHEGMNERMYVRMDIHMAIIWTEKSFSGSDRFKLKFLLKMNIILLMYIQSIYYILN